MVETSKLRRLRWSGHLTRGNGTSTCRNLTCRDKHEGTRRPGRPNLRWMDSVEKDLRILLYGDGKERCWTGTYGKGSWKMPRPTKGCSASEEKEEEEEDERIALNNMLL
jgi:hypothetical protein